MRPRPVTVFTGRSRGEVVVGHRGEPRGLRRRLQRQMIHVDAELAPRHLTGEQVPQPHTRVVPGQVGFYRLAVLLEEPGEANNFPGSCPVTSRYDANSS